MTNDEIKAQAIADVAKEAGWTPDSVARICAFYRKGVGEWDDVPIAYAVAQREQNIRLVMEARWVRDHVHEFGASSNWPVIFSRLSRVLDAQVQAAPEKAANENL